MRCDACHAIVEWSWRWCPDCGGSLSPIEPASDTYSVDWAPPGSEGGRPARLRRAPTADASDRCTSADAVTAAGRTIRPAP
jgi:hypothetical protein